MRNSKVRVLGATSLLAGGLMLAGTGVASAAVLSVDEAPQSGAEVVADAPVASDGLSDLPIAAQIDPETPDEPGPLDPEPEPNPEPTPEPEPDPDPIPEPEPEPEPEPSPLPKPTPTPSPAPSGGNGNVEYVAASYDTTPMLAQTGVGALALTGLAGSGLLGAGTWAVRSSRPRGRHVR